MGDRLRAVWDFSDLAATQKRFEMRMDEEIDAARRAEVLTQLARVEGLHGRFGEDEQLLKAAAALGGDVPVVAIRISLERGRLAGTLSLHPFVPWVGPSPLLDRILLDRILGIGFLGIGFLG